MQNDYGFRFYDPQLGCWHVPDPLAEQYISLSPFNYVLNNPVNHTDPNGLLPAPKIRDGEGSSGSNYDYSAETLSPSYENYLSASARYGDHSGLTYNNGYYYYNGDMISNSEAMRILKSYTQPASYTIEGNSLYVDMGGWTATLGLREDPVESFLSELSAAHTVTLEAPRSKMLPMPEDKAWEAGATTEAALDGSNGGDEPQSTGVQPGFDVDKAVDYLNSNAHSESKKECSTHVQNALVAGGIKADNPILAGRKYGPLLEGWGFNKVTTALTNYSPIKGDIAVIQGYSGGTADKNGTPYGHIQMYNGNQWVSDFFQNRPFWPGRDYEKYKPSFQIYRW